DRLDDPWRGAPALFGDSEAQAGPVGAEARVAGVLERAAARARPGEVHRHANRLVPALDHERGGHRRVHAARHRHDDAARAHASLAPRARETRSGSIASTASIWASSVPWPTLKRSVPRASAFEKPI